MALIVSMIGVMLDQRKVYAILMLLVSGACTFVLLRPLFLP